MKTEVNGKEVFVPQVYFAQQTLDDAENSEESEMQSLEQEKSMQKLKTFVIVRRLQVMM
ncbi:protein PfhB2 [Actinobacillus equuli]|nr:protein PfhB2 [Actinobacillus equuli]